MRFNTTEGETMTSQDTHRVYGTDAGGKTYRVSDDLSWSAAQWEWRRLDDLRRAGYMPHVRHFEVRSTDDTQPRFAEARVNMTLLRVALKTRGFKSVERAARAAWRHNMGDRFHDRRRDNAGERTGVQGRGGWFYYRNGQTAAQGLHGLTQVARRMGLFVFGTDGRYHVLDADAALDAPRVEMLAAREGVRSA